MRFGLMKGRRISPAEQMQDPVAVVSDTLDYSFVLVLLPKRRYLHCLAMNGMGLDLSRSESEREKYVEIMEMAGSSDESVMEMAVFTR
nr:hypothetical protein CFP56_44382 [Quercus suber]